jgi:Tol biopolymer transport system component
MIIEMIACAQIVAVAALVTGCRFGFDSLPIVDTDGSTTDSDSGAAPDTGGFPLGVFGGATKISVSTSNRLEDDPTLTADLLEMVFESDRMGGSGGSDLWITRRQMIGGAWATPIPVSNVNSDASEEHPGLSDDGLTLWFASDRGGGLGSFDIYVATRTDRSSGTPWSMPMPASTLNGVANDESPQVDSSELVMVMARGPNGAEDLFISTRATTASTWPEPTPIAELNQASTSETAPMMSADGQTIYFTSNRGGGGAELYLATRTTDRTFAAPTPISELDATLEQTDPWISPDQRTIVFVSDQDGTRDLWEATR